MNNTRISTITTALVLTSFIISGCAQRTPQMSTSQAVAAGASCNGQNFVEVNNTIGKYVEVYAYPQAYGPRRFLGIVGPGTERLPLPAPMGFIYAEVGGQRITGRMESRGRSSDISFTRGCEPLD